MNLSRSSLFCLLHEERVYKLQQMRKILIVTFFFLAISTTACRNKFTNPDKEQISIVKDSCLQLMNRIPATLSRSGPGGWLVFFEDNPEFFMASDGDMVFPDHKTAEKIITGTLSKEFEKIDLRWNQLRVDYVSDNFGTISAAFDETLFFFGGKKTTVEGYFTATGHRTIAGWKLLNAHWSIKTKQ